MNVFDYVNMWREGEIDRVIKCRGGGGDIIRCPSASIRPLLPHHTEVS